jgi:crotonobetainyl-CoA:carnitine CoA-transferase CaiB-like acyl-CoA transferase
MRDVLTDLIEDRLVTASSEHWLARIGAAGVPCGPVNDLAAALAHPVTAERALVHEVASDRFPGFRQLRLPIDTAGECAMREPPALGQDTAAVLAEAGLSPDEIDGLLPHPIPEATVTPR